MFWSAVFWSVAVAFSVAARKRNDGRQVGCCHTGAVRLDSGDLNGQARRVRTILDSGGLAQVDIFCSGNLTRLTMGDRLFADDQPPVAGAGRTSGPRQPLILIALDGLACLGLG